MKSLVSTLVFCTYINGKHCTNILYALHFSNNFVAHRIGWLEYSLDSITVGLSKSESPKSESYPNGMEWQSTNLKLQSHKSKSNQRVKQRQPSLCFLVCGQTIRTGPTVKIWVTNHHPTVHRESNHGSTHQPQIWPQITL